MTWRLHGWARFPIAAAAALLGAGIVFTELVVLQVGLRWQPVAGISFSPLLVPGVVLASLIGWGRLGVSATALRAWREFWIAGAGLLVAVSVAFLAAGGEAAALATVLVAAVEEELTFRLALPLAAGYATAVLVGRSSGSVSEWGTGARIVAVVTAAVVFAVQPGHLEQTTARWQIVPFLALGVLLTYVVLRTGHLVPGIVLHAVVNLATFAFVDGSLPYGLWAVIIVTALATFSVSWHLAARRLGIAVPVAVPEIDLTRDHPVAAAWRGPADR